VKEGSFDLYITTQCCVLCTSQTQPWDEIARCRRYKFMVAKHTCLVIGCCSAISVLPTRWPDSLRSTHAQSPRPQASLRCAFLHHARIKISCVKDSGRSSSPFGHQVSSVMLSAEPVLATVDATLADSESFACLDAAVHCYTVMRLAALGRSHGCV
jgi:hypothetical protein